MLVCASPLIYSEKQGWLSNSSQASLEGLAVSLEGIPILSIPLFTPGNHEKEWGEARRVPVLSFNFISFVVILCAKV